MCVNGVSTKKNPIHANLYFALATGQGSSATFTFVRL